MMRPVERHTSRLGPRRDDKSVNARSIADLAAYCVLGKIDNDHFRRVREIETACRRIDSHIIPAAFAADWDLVEKFVKIFSDRGRAQAGNRAADRGHGFEWHPEVITEFVRIA